jgi:hypothetical protein
MLPFGRAPIGQAYGLTETFAGATFSEWDDSTVGRVGPPLPCCYIKVSLDWVTKLSTEFHNQIYTLVCEENCLCLAHFTLH